MQRICSLLLKSTAKLPPNGHCSVNVRNNNTIDFIYEKGGQFVK